MEEEFGMRVKSVLKRCMVRNSLWVQESPLVLSKARNLLCLSSLICKIGIMTIPAT